MRPRLGPVSWLALVLGGAYFIIPLVATAIFSTETSRNGHDLSAYTAVLGDPGFHDSLWFSFKLAIATIIVSTILMVPTAYWVHLKLPRLRPLMDFTTILPLVVPPIVLVAGFGPTFGVDGPPILGGQGSWFYGEGIPGNVPPLLVGAYTVLAFPYVYRSLDTGLRAIDLKTLTEASQSLGAGWVTTLVRVIVPNLRPAILNGAFLTLAIVLGEFTIASILQYTPFSVYISSVGQSSGTQQSSLTIIAFLLTWGIMLALLRFTRAPGGGRRGASARGAP